MMKKLLLLIICLIFIFNLNAQTDDSLLAFPGAEGFGRFTTGGRGGKVIKVTNLNDDGPGSLRDAISKNYPRIIIFKVSGNIILNSELRVKSGNLTIAGQTAPGEGICIRDYPVVMDANNIIVRYIRIRLGDVNKIAEDSFWGRDLENIIIDHCSMSWALDENTSWYDNHNFTMQWCIIGESLYHSYHPKGDHGYGGIWGGMGATFHHNLIADNSSRNPRFNGARYNSTHETELTDFRNNVIFNWGFNSAYGGESGNYNLINNYYKPGPATDGGKKQYRIVNPSDDINPSGGYSKWYVDGNYIDGYPDVSANNWDGGVQPDKSIPLDSLRLYQPLYAAPVQTQSAEDAYDLVLKNAGANFPKRDSVDLRIVNETRTGSAPFGASYNGGGKGIIDSQNDVGGWPNLESTTAPADSDYDGMPDDWEISKGLNPDDSSDAVQFAPSGYTNIEEYINSLISSNTTTVEGFNNTPIDNFKLFQNYPNPFNPSTTIKYKIYKISNVKLDIFNSLGERVNQLINKNQEPGQYSVSWNGTDFKGLNLSTGFYIARLEAGNAQQVIKLLLLK